MFLSEILSLFSSIFPFFSSIFMIWMIVDCVRNQRVRNKAGWIVFILLTQFIGSIVYFFTRGPWVRQNLFSLGSVWRDHTPHDPVPQASTVPQQMQEVFPDYTRGYQTQQHDPAPVSQTAVQMSETLSLQAEYEQPLVMYPDAPQGE